jgi:alkanesulfonate monooxygenase SsuD/methylene tetrahydromethanopterin reductase-like flavin-dependent oxidoreductase (luciferase family)
MPIQKPHPPLLIGGSGEKVTLRLVARYAQLCNVSGDPATVAHRLGILREHCDSVGRPYQEITRTVYTTVLIGRDEAEVAAKRERLGDFLPRSGALVGTPEQLIAMLRDYAAAGCQHMIFRTPDWIDVEPIRLFAERVIPALADA